MAPPAHIMGSPLAARMVINGRPMDYFCGTSYYAFHGNPASIEAANRATTLYGMGPGTLAGEPVYDETIALSKRYFEAETATFMISGYLSTMVLMQALQDDYDLILVDEASHYSVYDALRITGKPIFTFRNRDPASLGAELARHVTPGKTPVVVTDGIFPSTGAIAPLADYVQAMRPYDNALLVVDDSHGVGVMGPKGQGTLDHFGLTGPNHYLAGTLSKAFGGSGGIVPGSQALADKIARHVRLLSGASLPPIPAAAAAAFGLRTLLEQPELRDTLRANIARMRGGLRGLGLEIADTPVPIVSVRAPDTDLEKLRLALEERDLAIKRVGPSSYSDAPPVETLRIAVFATHTAEQIDRLVAGISELL